MTSPDSPVNLDGIKSLAEILMGAAYADEVFVGTEALAIHKILRDLLGSRELPEELDAYLDAFDPEAFDLATACSKLHLGSSNERRSVLALVAEVTDADNIYDLAEDAYIRRVARCIGASKEEYADLTVEVLSISSLTQPPPVPRE